MRNRHNSEVLCIMAVIQFEMSKRTCFNDAQLTVVDGCTILYKHEEVLHRDTTQ